MIPVIMPQIGQDVETGVITRWNKQVGESVKKGEVLASVEGDKATFDIEAEAGGVLLEIVVAQGQEGKVLEPVAFIGEPGENSGSAPVRGPAVSAQISAPSVPSPSSVVGQARGARRFSSPSARRIARDLGVEVGRIAGSGPGGRVVKKDVLAAVQQPAGRRGDTVIPHSRMRQLIAQRLSLSKSTIPHFYLFQDVDMEEALERRELYNRRNGCQVTITDMVVQAAALALAEFPRLNAHVDDRGLTVKGAINIGVATATEDGLMVPVIPEADTKDIRALSAEIKAKAEQARRGRLDPSARGGFTITSLGMFGTQSFLPIINPPEAAILGVGAAQARPAAVGGLLGVRRQMTLTLACDHRAVSGDEAARFLGRLRDILASSFRPVP
jgi:pyruvate dehydrogenase E2 component (dihydrolipoamide acetyltransferase)